METSFRVRFAALFESHFGRVFRYLDRLSGEPDLASDLAQEAFVRMYRRGSLPDDPESWLITVATNLFRNARSTRARRKRLLTVGRAERALGDPPPAPHVAAAGAGDTAARVRGALEALPERDRQLLLLRAEGYRYREIAAATGIRESSTGTLLARAKAAFRKAYEERCDAP